jgi:uncharacterized protein with von Willebrand factor type A (vWA) domain
MGERQVVPTDRWDDADLTEIRAQITPMAKAADRLTDVNWTGERLLTDVFHSVHKARPQIRDARAMDPTFRVNQEVMAQLTEDDTWARLRNHTVGDPFAAGLATVTMAEYLAGLYEKLADAQEKADAAQQARDAADQAAADGVDGDELAGLSNAADFAAGEAEDALDRMRASVGKAIRQAAGAAEDEAQQAATSMAGWGLNPGEITKMDPATRLRLADRLAGDRMRGIAAKFGRLRNEVEAMTTSRFQHGPEELHGITLSDDVSRLIGAELVNLSVPELATDFADRYSRKQLQTYWMRQIVREARGGIVYLDDSSESMRGVPEQWSRAVGLTLLAIAKEQGRSFKAIVFGGPGVMQVHDFGADASTSTLDQMLDYAEVSLMDAGTEFQGPLDLAAAHLVAEFEATGRADADIVLATDGQCSVKAKWLEKFQETQGNVGFRVFGIAISVGVTDSLRKICDAGVAEVTKLTDGSEISAMFEKVTKEKELVL